jgi:phosphoribosylformylglycinamidine cyclo-ligase
VPGIFALVEREGGVARDEMYRTFNMGLGLVAVVPAAAAAEARAVLRDRGLDAWEVGRVEAGAGEATCEVIP